MTPDFIERMKASAYSISFIDYRSYHLPTPDPSPSTLELNSNFLHLGRSGGRP